MYRVSCRSLWLALLGAKTPTDATLEPCGEGWAGGEGNLRVWWSNELVTHTPAAVMDGFSILEGGVTLRRREEMKWRC